mmetsp:Transcript_45181/g.142237  ORF Transcript_45181/g.142237 Transcript_45181/m.142237 type:complete len:204 (+) Transcript_45181:582-1193(+)
MLISPLSLSPSGCTCSFSENFSENEEIQSCKLLTESSGSDSVPFTLAASSCNIWSCSLKNEIEPSLRPGTAQDLSAISFKLRVALSSSWSFCAIMKSFLSTSLRNSSSSSWNSVSRSCSRSSNNFTRFSASFLRMRSLSSSSFTSTNFCAETPPVPSCSPPPADLSASISKSLEAMTLCSSRFCRCISARSILSSAGLCSLLM